MHVLENSPVFHRILQACFILEGLGVGLEVDHIPAVLLLRQNLSDHGIAPLVWIRLRLLSAAVQTLALPVSHRRHDLILLQDTRNRFIALPFHGHA